MKGSRFTIAFLLFTLCTIAECLWSGDHGNGNGDGDGNGNGNQQTVTTIKCIDECKTVCRFSKNKNGCKGKCSNKCGDQSAQETNFWK